MNKFLLFFLTSGIIISQSVFAMDSKDNSQESQFVSQRAAPVVEEAESLAQRARVCGLGPSASKQQVEEAEALAQRGYNVGLYKTGASKQEVEEAEALVQRAYNVGLYKTGASKQEVEEAEALAQRAYNVGLYKTGASKQEVEEAEAAWRQRAMKPELVERKD